MKTNSMAFIRRWICRVAGHKWEPGCNTTTMYVADRCTRCRARRPHGDGPTAVVGEFLRQAGHEQPLGYHEYGGDDVWTVT